MNTETLVEDWGGLKKLVAELRETGEVTVEHDVVLQGRSDAPRQIDFLVRDKQGLYEHLIVVECKYWNSPVERLHVDALATTSTPDTTQPVNRFPPNLSQEIWKPLVLESSDPFSLLNRWFTRVQLSVSYLTGSSGLLTESRTTVWPPIQQHPAVCNPLLQAGHGGPPTISRTASSCKVPGTLEMKRFGMVEVVEDHGAHIPDAAKAPGADDFPSDRFENRSGKYSEEDYAGQRAELGNEAAAVLAEIDSIESAGRTRRGTAGRDS